MFDRLKNARLCGLDRDLIIIAVPMAVFAVFPATRVIALVLGLFFLVMLYARIRLTVRYRQLKAAFPDDLNTACGSCAERVLPCYFFLSGGFLDAANACYLSYDEIELVEAEHYKNSEGSECYRVIITAGGKKYGITKIGDRGGEAEAYADMCSFFAAHIPGERLR